MYLICTLGSNFHNLQKTIHGMNRAEVYFCKIHKKVFKLEFRWPPFERKKELF